MDIILKNIENDNINKANSSLKMKKDMVEFLRKNYKGNNILEFGTAWGNSTAILSQICKEKGGKVYTVDLYENRAQKSKNLLKKLNLLDYAVFIVADLYKNKWQQYIDNVEFSFIDCVHTIEAVKIDTQNAINLGSKFICYHDYGLNLIKSNINSSSAVKLYLKTIENKYKNQLLIGEVQGKWITSYGTNDYEGCIIEII
jgi:tRNA A58 N-methylase Trm61